MVFARKPVGEVEQHAREEAGLGHAEQEPDDGEARRVVDEGHDGGEDAPRDHDARDPYPRADLFHDYVARHLEDEVAQEERSERKSEVGRGQLKITSHRQACEADINAINVSQNVGQHREWQQAQVDLAHRGFFGFRFQANLPEISFLVPGPSG